MSVLLAFPGLEYVTCSIHPPLFIRALSFPSTTHALLTAPTFLLNSESVFLILPLTEQIQGTLATMLFPTSFFLLASAFSSTVVALKEHQHRAVVANPRHHGEISRHVERNLTERGYQCELSIVTRLPWALKLAFLPIDNNMRATWYGMSWVSFSIEVPYLGK